MKGAENNIHRERKCVVNIQRPPIRPSISLGDFIVVAVYRRRLQKKNTQSVMMTFLTEPTHHIFEKKLTFYVLLIYTFELSAVDTKRHLLD